jgi:Rieske Fe-S protein
MTTARTAGPAATPAASAEPAGTPEPALPEVSRRQWVRDVAVAGTVVAAGAGLAACTTPSQNATGPAPGPAPVRAFPSGGASGGTGGGAAGGGVAGGTKGAKPTGKPTAPTIPGEPQSLVVTRVSSIPVGGGVIYPSHGVVVTQPKAGTYKCFSASCTHLGCTVNKVADGLIQCPCHGARFSIVDGSVKAGPAPRPLPKQAITIEDGAVVLD